MALTSLWLLTLMATAICLTMARQRSARIIYRDCSAVPQGQKSAVYSINPDRKKPFKVYCDMETDGGGWTVFQRRIGEEQKKKKKRKKEAIFSGRWADYKKGFGNFKTSFWLGNDKLHRLTANRAVSLRVEVSTEKYSKKGNHATSYATYKTFAVGDENSLYNLTVQGYEGSAGDALKHHNHMPFSTWDKDNDKALRNCAESYHGGWWYKSCLHSNLNGEYLEKKVTHGPGIVWLKGKFRLASLKFSEMKLKPVDCDNLGGL